MPANVTCQARPSAQSSKQVHWKKVSVEKIKEVHKNDFNFELKGGINTKVVCFHNYKKNGVLL